MESISRISGLLEAGESPVLSPPAQSPAPARELTLDAAQATRGIRTSSKLLDRNQMRKLLDSRNEREVLEGLRRVISMMYRNHKTLPFFSSVVKNVASPNLEIKKLVYIYLIHHAEQEPDLALLSINTIQKSLSDTNPQVRALALKTMSGIRVPVISQIVSLAIKKGVADMSPLVRKAAALSIPKCYRLDPSQSPQLLEYLATLLGDKQYYVAGAAVSAFLEICPERIDMIHKHYRGLVKKIVDMDEWSQLATLKLMTYYARKCFPRRAQPATVSETSQGRTQDSSIDDFYGETTSSKPAAHSTSLDSDLTLLLNGIRPLLQSRNSGVVVAVTRCYIDVGTPDYVKHAIGPLVALLRGAQDIQQIALYNIVSVCLVRPLDFVKYASHFLVRATDSAPIWELKLEVLALIFPHSSVHVKSLILKELEHFSQGSNKALVREAVRAIGRCAQADAATAPRCLKLLLSQITSLDGTLAAESLTVIRHLIQQDAEAHAGTVVRLAKNLDSATDPQARATIIWLVGEFSGLNGEDNIAPDVFRILLKDFSSESEAARRQILLLGAKVYLHHLNRKSEVEQNRAGEDDPPQEEEKHPIERLWDYVLLLVRYDVSFDLRDRARMYRAVLSVPQLATLMLLAPKPAPQAPSPSESRKGFLLGSSTLVLAGGGGLHGLRGYETLPNWVEPGKEPDPRLREPERDAASSRYDSDRPAASAADKLDEVVRSAPAGKSNGLGESLRTKTLDDWLAEEEEEEEEEEESEEEESEEEEDDEDEEDDDEEEEEEDSDDDGETDRLVKS
ncbi:ap-3 adaptor complex beta-adaptin subunit [Trichoderma arundinaceum]|uniref:Ap-3 adaptor complex beta-adaptin subunit n=1 Tax=Trichoderma arundinaceum TaxID=490622 RepID=A0A395NVU6_TRIAR|nr:ap-3 adaptor complex beta-adaptin subunit [Trichoderma arundinaceum]